MSQFTHLLGIRDGGGLAGLRNRLAVKIFCKQISGQEIFRTAQESCSGFTNSFHGIALAFVKAAQNPWGSRPG